MGDAPVGRDAPLYGECLRGGDATRWRCLAGRGVRSGAWVEVSMSRDYFDAYLGLVFTSFFVSLFLVSVFGTNDNTFHCTVHSLLIFVLLIFREGGLRAIVDPREEKPEIVFSDTRSLSE